MDSPLRILVVEDDPDIAAGTCRLLERAGYAPTAVGTGAEALTHVRSDPPDLVLLDRQLPDMDGLEVCREIKGTAAASIILVIIASAVRVKQQEQIAGLETGADGYILRPIDNRELLLRIEPFARITRLNRRLSQELARALSLEEEMEDRVWLRTAELATSNQRLEDARRAALNLMQDATSAQRQLAAANQDLRRSERLFRLDFEEAPVGRCLVGLDGRFLKTNQAFCTLQGRSASELGGMSFLEVTHPEDRDASREGMRQLLDGTLDRLDLEKRCLVSGQRTVWTFVRVGLLRDETGAPLHFSVYIQDISERKQAEAALLEREEQLRGIASSIPGAIYQFVRKPDGSVAIPFMSEGARLLFDRPLQELQNPAHLFDDVHPEDVPRLWASIEASAKDLTPWNVEFRLVPKARPLRWLRGASNPRRLPDGGVCWNGVLLDVTEQKRSDEQSRLQHRLALALAAVSDLRQGLGLCLEIALQASGLDAGGFYLVAEGSGALELCAPLGLPPGFVHAVTRYEATSDQTRLVMAGLPVYARYEDLGLSLSEAERREGLRLIAIIPLRHEGKVIGCMNVASHVVDDLPPTSRQVLETIAATATQAIVRMRAEAQLRRSEALLNHTQRLSKVGGWEWDVIRQTMVWTEETYRIHGLKSEDFSPGSEEHIRRSVGCYAAEHQTSIVDAFRRCSERGEAYDLEVPFTSVTGRSMWVRTTAQAVWEGDRVVRVVGNLMDITERKQAEQALRESEEFRTAIFDSMAAHVAVVNHAGIILAVNATWERFRNENPLAEGNPARKCGLGDDYLEVCRCGVTQGAEGAMTAGEGIRSVLAGEAASFTMEYPCHSPTEQRWFSMVVTPLSGGRRGAVVAHTCITELKRAQEALAEDEAHLKAVIRAAPTGVGLVANRVLLEVNERVLEMTGYTREELIGVNTRLLYPTEEDFLYVGSEKYRQIAERGTGTVESRWLRKDGAIRDVLLSSTPLDLADLSKGVVFTALDVTEHKRLEAVVRENSERLSAAIRGADLGTWDWDILTGKVVFNERWAEMLGHTLEQVPPHFSEWEKRIHPEDQAGVRHALQAHLDGLTDFYETVHRLKHHSGAWIWILDRGRVSVRDAGDRPVRMCGTHLDITARKQAEEALRASEKQYRLLVENLHAGLVVHGSNTQITIANQQASELLGLSVAQMTGKTAIDPAWRFVREDETAMPLEEYPVRRVLATGQPLEDLVLGIDRPATEDRVWVVVNAFPEFDAEGRLSQVVVTFFDITARKRAEAEREKIQSQLTQAQKMESVGRLAGGVAHDFNNMMAIILGYTGLALRRVDANEPLHAELAEIRTAAQRSANLTRQLLAFARKQAITPKVLDLNDTVEGMLKLLRRLIGEHIVLQWSPGGELWQVRMDPAQIDQMLANLCVNARDAIAGSGRITVATCNTVLHQEDCVGQTGFTPGEYVMLAVSDDGCGMDSKTLQLIFEPFFTTKGVGEGTGLGLATVHGIVKQNHGLISVRSELGRGTTFRIYLPRITAEKAPPTGEASIPTVARAHETILMVEDERAMLNMTKLLLEDQGYRVLAASTPAEAIRLAGEHMGRIDLLLTDVVMPEMNGPELAKCLSSTRPDLKHLFMSGYAAEIIARHGVMNEGEHFLPKPFSATELAAKLRKVLDERTAEC